MQLYVTPLPLFHTFSSLTCLHPSHYANRPGGTVFVIGEIPDLSLSHKVTPKRGDIVTFSYSYLSTATGLPHDVRMLRVRRDVTWEQVMDRAEDDVDEKLENSMFRESERGRKEGRRRRRETMPRVINYLQL